jgi:hypothetical protein
MRLTDFLDEDANPARQAAKAIWNKKHHKKPKGVAEGSLEELANTSLKVKEPKGLVNTNDRKQVTYKIMKFKSGKDTYLINFTVKGAPAFGKKSNWNAVNVAFGVREEQDEYSFGDEMNTDLTARNKNQFLIYSTVINAIRKFITEYNTEIDEIIMQGAGLRQEAMYQRFFQSAGKYFPGWHHDGKQSLVRDVPRQTGKKVREQGVAEGSDKSLLKQVKPHCRNAWVSNGRLWVECDPLQVKKIADLLNTKPMSGSVMGEYAFDLPQGVAEEDLDAQFDMIEDMVESIARQHGVDAEFIWEYLEPVSDQELLETAAWKRKAGKNKNGGLNRKGVMSYRREHPGSKLQTAVTTKPSKLKPGSKAAKRRKSFCARMSGMKGAMKKPNGDPTRKALALRKWNC